MNERDREMQEQNDPAKHAEGEVGARTHDESTGPEAANAGSPSPGEAEMRRDQVPDEF
jgi:hypothetical protein